MKNFCKNLKSHVLKVSNSGRQNMPKKRKSREKQKLCYICGNKFDNNQNMFWKVGDHCHYEKYRGAAHLVCNLIY